MLLKTVYDQQLAATIIHNYISLSIIVQVCLYPGVTLVSALRTDHLQIIFPNNLSRVQAMPLLTLPSFIVSFFSSYEKTLIPSLAKSWLLRDSQPSHACLYQTYPWIIYIQTGFLHVGTSSPESGPRRKAPQQSLNSGWVHSFLIPCSFFHLCEQHLTRESTIAHSDFEILWVVWNSVCILSSVSLHLLRALGIEDMSC